MKNELTKYTCDRAGNIVRISSVTHLESGSYVTYIVGRHDTSPGWYRFITLDRSELTKTCLPSVAFGQQ